MPRMKKTLLHVRNVRKVYGDGDAMVEAVRGVDLDIEEGEFVAFMGASGSGKSTLMNILAFLDTPSSGTFHFGGADVTEFCENDRAFMRNRVLGFIFQQFHLLPRTSAVDNVRLPLHYAGVGRKEQLRRSTAMLTKVGLANRVDHLPNQLSGGQQQRVSIARALVNDPAVLFCDEPTGNLDSTTAHEIMAMLVALHREGRTIIMVTHEQDIAAYAQRLFIMKDGVIV